MSKIIVNKYNTESNFRQSLVKPSSPLSKCCGNFFVLVMFGILFAVVHRHTVTV